MTGNTSDSILLTYIQECVRNGRYFFVNHALTKHPLAEGFTPSDALEAIDTGSIISHREDEARCLISGTAKNVVPSSDYIENYIHLVVRYDDIQNIVIITMYRPSSSEWVSHYQRRT